MGGHVELAALLIEKGADVDIADEVMGGRGLKIELIDVCVK